MYDTDSNVTITGASSGISTTLATSGGINASANQLILQVRVRSHQVQLLELFI